MCITIFKYHKFPLHPKVEALDGHVHVLDSSFAQVTEQMAIPVSQVEAQDLWNFINTVKDATKTCDSDVKDARRRINAAKPKQRRGERAAEAADYDGSSEGSASV